MLEKTMRLNYLFDFYQALLTPKQREYLNMYYLEDLALVEIANIAEVSRQAIYDNIKRTEAILESYEDKLSLYEKFEQRINLLKQLQDIVENKNNSKKTNEIIYKLIELG